ncbi:MAG: hypothetical protein KAH86_04460, partial [Methanosarcinales archaeon]|nr:hypothetical protein [Methanosarcinales archaeon]
MYGIWVIAKWELKRSSLNFTRNTAIAIVFLLLLIAATSAIVGQTGMQMNSKIYTVAVNDPVVYDVIDTDIRFSTVLANPDTAARIYQRGDADVLIIGRNVYSKDTEKSKAAKTALMSTFILHRELTLTAYGDVNNSFPVWVYLHYLDRGSGFEVPTTRSIAESREGIFEETPESPGYTGRKGGAETVYTVNEKGQMV